jgi:hypothetical protein
MLGVDHRIECRRFPGQLRAWFHALQVMDRPMALIDTQRIKSCLLELPIDVTREDKTAALHGRTPFPKQREACMGHRFAVKRQSVPVEAPCAAWIGVEGRWRGDVHEPDTVARKRWIGFPESGVSTKVRKARIDTDTRAGGDDQGIGLRNQGGRLLDRQWVGSQCVEIVVSHRTSYARR